MTDGYGRDAGPEVDAAPDVDAADIDADAREGDVDATPHRVDVGGVDERGGGGGDLRGGRLAGAHPEAADRRFDWRGWTLVGAIFVSFLVIPGVIVLYPHVGPMLGLTFWDTYLALPLIPAVVLALLAVWATTRP